MKNKIYILGWIGCLMTITGGLFKIMHWPMAGVMLTLGLTFLAVVFFPVALRSNYISLGRKKPLLYVAINLTIFLNITGALFKIQHWPGAGYLMIGGILSPLVLFLPVYLYYHFKSEEQSLNNFFSILFLLVSFSVMDVLLTVRLGKDVLDIPSDVINTTNLNDYFTVKKEVCYRQLLNDTGNYSKSQLVQDIKSKSESLNTLIEDIKSEIITIASDGDKSKLQDYRAIKMKDNSNIPAFVMFNDNNKGAKLHKSIDKLRESLLLSFNGESKESIFVSELLKVDSRNKGKTWEENEFSNSPVVYALYQLNTIQENIAFAEIETLNSMCKGLKE
jgi:hypothetical protein